MSTVENDRFHLLPDRLRVTLVEVVANEIARQMDKGGETDDLLALLRRLEGVDTQVVVLSSRPPRELTA